MGFLSDLLLAGGAFGAAIFCFVLSRRLRALTALDGGMGTAIAVLSAQVDDLTRALRAAQDAAQGNSGRLIAQTDRAEAACQRLELLIASLHDLPGPEQGNQPATAPRPDRATGADPDRDSMADRDKSVTRSRILRRRNDERAA